MEQVGLGDGDGVGGGGCFCSPAHLLTSGDPLLLELG